MRAHHLRRNEKLETIDQVLIEESRVKVRAGFGEKSEDVRGAEVVEDGGKGNAAHVGGDAFDADAQVAEFGGADVVEAGREDEEIVLGRADDL